MSSRELMGRQLRAMPMSIETREDADDPVIEGYFAVFGQNYEITDRMSESIDPAAFDGALSGDIRALINHDTTLVLGRTPNHTLELKTDAHGLWGRITVNKDDSDAMNLYARVKRGDVSQCSIGFDILSEDIDYTEDHTHWTIKQVKLYEVSCCTFPAYTETNIAARSKQLDDIKGRETAAWKARMLDRLQKGGEEDGVKSTDVAEKD